jgi:hypothetical protein
LRGGELIKQLATGGLALGGGVGAAVVLVNYLKSMQQEADIEDETRLNDDTLYLPKAKRSREKSAAEVNRWLAPGLAITGGVVASGAAYALTQAVYNYLQKKHRQGLLDEAQNETLVAADLEAEKSAAEMSLADLVTAFPVAVPLLAALASGGVAYAALNKTFPVVNPPKSKYPRRIRQVSEGGEVEIPEEELEHSKSASVRWASDDCEAAAMEFLTLFVDRVAMEKGATCVTSDILNRVAAEGPREVTRALKDCGLVSMCEVVKGASLAPADVKAVSAAVIHKSARLGPAVSAIAAAELFDMLPNVTGLCDRADSDQMDKLAGLGALMQLSWCRPQIEKAASSLGEGHPLLQALVAMLSGAPKQEQAATPLPSGGGSDDRDAALTSDVSGSMGEDNEGDDSDEDLSHSDDNESQGDDDVVDAFMGDPKKAPPPTD